MVEWELYYWLIIFAVLLVIEALTLGLTTIWFAAGALAAWISGILGGNLAVQILIFLVVSLILLFFTRPIARKHFNNSRVRTGAERLLDGEGVVIEEIDTLKAAGRVEVRGQEWAARTAAPDGRIAKGKTVIVEKIEGVHLIVKESEEKA